MTTSRRTGFCASCESPTSKRGDLLCATCWTFVAREFVDRFMALWRRKYRGENVAAAITRAEDAIVNAATKRRKAA